MNRSRRDFLKKSAMLAGGTGMIQTLPLSIQKAMAINPDPGTTFYDAEHVVLLMQENRSFDHLYGCLQGVRGFNDPRAIRLPDNNLVWLQSDKSGTYAPFRLDIKDSKVTWMGSLPHSWGNQVEARNQGKYDRWLEVKRSGYDDMPFTLGHYTREDLPFYYALADAFTVCDHHFCSSLTGTTPNRLYYWSGTLREEQNGASPANVENAFINYSHPAHWKTFPERLEDHDISWKIYQNELSVGVGFKGEEESWLGNFTDNPIEWFSQYHVRFSPAHIRYMKQRAAALRKEIPRLKDAKEKEKKQRLLRYILKGLEKYNAENFEKLSPKEQSIHKKAFTTNKKDPDYHKLTTLAYEEDGKSRTMQLPKGDILYQFREDVKNGRLPTVSWLVGPQRFSDHPSSPWYGAWYVSEVLDILTQNPEVWKKTVFILTYDENDGYFDHLPPFTAPDPDDPTTGICSEGIDTTVDYVTQRQVDAFKGTYKDPKRVSPVGLGYRVPFVVASPWSRGGKINSQVFDSTSVLMFLEKFLTKKTGRPVKEENISEWRRTICGDLTSVFTPYNGEEIKLPDFIDQQPFVENIYNAQFKGFPSGYRKLSKQEITQINEGHLEVTVMPRQEQGIRSSCALPYELYAYGGLINDSEFELQLEAADSCFGRLAAGAPFYIYDINNFAVRNYAVRAGDKLTDLLPVKENYHFKLYGPNGFFREFKGNIAEKPGLQVRCAYERRRLNRKKPTGNIELHFSEVREEYLVLITDNAYHQKAVQQKIGGSSNTITLDLKDHYGWYDFSFQIKGFPQYVRRFAGHVETGRGSYTDPFMGRVTKPA